MGLGAEPGAPANPGALSRQMTPVCFLIPKLLFPAAQLSPELPLNAPLDDVAVLLVAPNSPCPAVQLDAPPLPTPGLAVLLLVSAEVAGEALGVALVLDGAVLVLDGVVLVLSWVSVCCVCADPAQGKTIAARIAIRNAFVVFAPLMV